MKIFDATPSGNEIAEYVGVDYIKFSLNLIEEIVKRLKTTRRTAQPLLAHIEILLIVSEKYVVDANLFILKERVQEWKEVFYKWYDRVNSKIPAKYRQGIKESADELFAELDKYGH